MPVCRAGVSYILRCIFHFHNVMFINPFSQTSCFQKSHTVKLCERNKNVICLFNSELMSEEQSASHILCFSCRKWYNFLCRCKHINLQETLCCKLGENVINFTQKLCNTELSFQTFVWKSFRCASVGMINYLFTLTGRKTKVKTVLCISNLYVNLCQETGPTY